MKGRAEAWEGYWTTKVGWASEGKILVRGYRAEELIRRLSFAEAAYLVIRGELPTPAQARALDAVLRSGLDQAFINSAVPPARFAASAAPEAPAAAIAAGVIAFGSVTGSPRECAQMIQAAHAEMNLNRLTPAEACRRVVEQHRRGGRKIPGLGHPLHKRGDPRARALREIAVGLGVWGERARLLDGIEREATRSFARPLTMNLAGAVAAVLLEIGFDSLEMVGLAILGYMPALIAHTVEEIREGAPLRIIPETLGARYAGPAERSLPHNRKRREDDDEAIPGRREEDDEAMAVAAAGSRRAGRARPRRRRGAIRASQAHRPEEGRLRAHGPEPGPPLQVVGRGGGEAEWRPGQDRVLPR